MLLITLNKDEWYYICIEVNPVMERVRQHAVGDSCLLYASQLRHSAYCSARAAVPLSRVGQSIHRQLVSNSHGYRTDPVNRHLRSVGIALCTLSLDCLRNTRWDSAAWLLRVATLSVGTSDVDQTRVIRRRGYNYDSTSIRRSFDASTTRAASLLSKLIKCTAGAVLRGGGSKSGPMLPPNDVHHADIL